MYFILLLMIIVQTTADKILVLHPVYAGSHIHALRRLNKNLISRGHEVRVVRWFESSSLNKLDIPGIKETLIAVNNSDGSLKFMTKAETASFSFPAKYMWDNGLNPFSVLSSDAFAAVTAACETLLTKRDLILDLKKEKFSVAVVDLIYNECGLALAHHIGIPAVAYWGLTFTSGETQYTSSFNSPSYIPHVYIPYTDRMNFMQRVANVFYGIGSHLVMQNMFRQTNNVIQKHLPDSPHPSELIANLSGILINSHPVLDYSKQLPPTFLQVGGIHIEATKALPKAIKEFIESSSDEGAILFSMGMNFELESVPREIFEAFFKAFSRVKRKIIVRTKGIPTNIPSNVLILPHLPQNDILAHPKINLFITHCGMHGVMEAIHHSVPMIGMPLFFDQKNVLTQLVYKGVAIGLHKGSTEDEIYEAISTMAKNESYRQNMKYLSALYHSYNKDPLERATWLVEHVSKYEGASYLKLSSRHLNFFQYFCIDVLLFYAFLILALIFVIYKSFSLCFCCKRRRRNTSTKNKQKKT